MFDAPRIRTSALVPLVFIFIFGVIGSTVGCAPQPTTPQTSSPTESAPPHESFTIDSRILGESRKIHVLEPLGQPGLELPTLYMLDGGLHEDFPHVATTLLAGIEDGSLRPMRLVGIENTERRRDLSGETTVASDREMAPRVGGSVPFRRFVREELIPTIEGRYAATKERVLIGESLAGYFVLETLFFEPSAFTGYIAIDPSVWWNDPDLVRNAAPRLANIEDTPVTLYLTAANAESNGPDVERLNAILESSAPKNWTIHYAPRPDLEHATIFRAVEADAYRALFRR